MNPCVYNNEALEETIKIADVLAELVSKFAIQKKKFRIQNWLALLDEATDLIIELHLLRLEDIIG